MRLVLRDINRLEPEDEPPVSLKENPGYSKMQVLCCAICRTDAKMWEQGHRDLVFPRVPGHEMVVRDQGNNRYVVWPGDNCEECEFCLQKRANLCDRIKICGFNFDGGFADQVMVPDKSLIPVPGSLDSHVACFAEPVGCVVNALENVFTEPNGRILIYGGGTMGLLAALYAKYHGWEPCIVESDSEKICNLQHFLEHTGISCGNSVQGKKFSAAILACPDLNAFGQAIQKVDKGGQISFFSGITKGEYIDTHLLNLVHYKELQLTGAYGTRKESMEMALDFMSQNSRELWMLVEDVVSPWDAPRLIPGILSGKYLKYILDFTIQPEA